MRRLVVVPALLCTVLYAGCPPAATPPPSGFRAVSFGGDFAWGTATAGWQVEGDQGVNGAVDSNWKRWVDTGHGRGGQTNPDGNGFFTKFDGDAGLAADLGLDSFRLSIDWSRIEPQPGVFDDDELDHVVDVLTSLRAHGLKPVVTLWHWTVPPWVQDGAAVDRMATDDRSVVDDFEGFVRHVIPRIKDQVDEYTVLNEPLSMVVVGYVDGAFPPGHFLDIPAATKFGITLMYMHARAYDVIHELDGNATVGITMAANDIYPENPDNTQEQLAAESLGYVYNDWVIQALTAGDVDSDLSGTIDPGETKADPALVHRLDFIGVQYYGPIKVKQVSFLDHTSPIYGQPLVDVANYIGADEANLPQNGMGREINASDFAATLDHYATWGLPLVVTENGTTVNRRPVGDDPAVPLTMDEDQAAMYLVVHIWEVGRAVHRGVDVRGYFHWTLADNYEWVEGRLQRFGAYTVDFTDPTYPRKKNKMGQALADIVAAGGVTEEIWNRYVLAKFPTDATKAGHGPTTSEPVVGPLD